MDFFDPSSGSQVHDFNPGITTNGLIWVVQIPDDAVVISGNTLTIHVANLAIADEIAFLGTVRIPSTLSFDVTYTKSGKLRKIEPTSQDPLGAFHWTGKMWMATNSGTFSVSRNDGSFSATGSFSSSGMFGEMGKERNGVFVDEDDQNEQESSEQAAEPAESRTVVGACDSPGASPRQDERNNQVEGFRKRRFCEAAS